MNTGGSMGEKADSEITHLDTLPTEIVLHIFSFVFTHIIEWHDGQKQPYTATAPSMSRIRSILRPISINRRLRLIGMDEALRTVLPGIISPDGDYKHQDGDKLVVPAYKSRPQDHLKYCEESPSDGPTFCGVARHHPVLELQIFVSMRRLLSDLVAKRDGYYRRLAAAARVCNLREDLKLFVERHAMAVWPETVTINFSRHDLWGDWSLQHTGVECPIFSPWRMNAWPTHRRRTKESGITILIFSGNECDMKIVQAARDVSFEQLFGGGL